MRVAAISVMEPCKKVNIDAKAWRLRTKSMMRANRLSRSCPLDTATSTAMAINKGIVASRAVPRSLQITLVVSILHSSLVSASRRRSDNFLGRKTLPSSSSSSSSFAGLLAAALNRSRKLLPTSGTPSSLSFPSSICSCVSLFIFRTGMVAAKIAAKGFGGEGACAIGCSLAAASLAWCSTHLAEPSANGDDSSTGISSADCSFAGQAGHSSSLPRWPKRGVASAVAARLVANCGEPGLLGLFRFAYIQLPTPPTKSNAKVMELNSLMVLARASAARSNWSASSAEPLKATRSCVSLTRRFWRPSCWAFSAS
mmetsp:Transcript_659/g.2465  ORF Transcript_659/g.2465 Transcript_659/m.2465 type:complete len:312 (+) Transcript_659:1054-1989(+)